MRSMTGYGRGSARKDEREVTVELKSVNHRYLDLGFRLARTLGFAEPLLRTLLSEGLSRGHVDISLSYQNHRKDARIAEADSGLAISYLKAADDLARMAGLDQTLLIGDLLRLPDVIKVTEAEEDEDALREVIALAARDAMSALIADREREGVAIRSDLQGRLSNLRQLHEEMSVLAPQQPEQYRRKLNERIARLEPSGLDPQRLAQEVALFADKTAIDEELTRLAAHIEQMDSLLWQDEPSGRQMDFLVQEMNREVNTIGSKTSELSITRLVLDAKNALEKMREQIQNAE